MIIIAFFLQHDILLYFILMNAYSIFTIGFSKLPKNFINSTCNIVTTIFIAETLVRKRKKVNADDSIKRQ